MGVLVTGGAGYIGSHVVRQMTENGEKVVVLDDLSTGFAESLIHKENLVCGDVADQDLVRKIIVQEKISAVIHLAASIIVPESLADPLKYYSNNSMKTLSLIKNCVDQGVNKFIFSSTAAVYGHFSKGIFVESDEVSPLSPYGTSKLVSEWILRDAARAHGLNSVSLRYFNVAGADPQARMGQRNPRATHLIKICCQAALGSRPLVEIFGKDYETPDGTCMRDYVHVEDLAQAHLLALKKLQNQSGASVYNVGYGIGTSVLEVIDKVKAASKINFKTAYAPRRSGDAAKLVADASLIGRELGWKPLYRDVEKIVEDAWRWELKLSKK